MPFLARDAVDVEASASLLPRTSPVEGATPFASSHKTNSSSSSSSSFAAAVAVAVGCCVGIAAYASSVPSSSAMLGSANGGVDLLLGATTFPRTTRITPKTIDDDDDAATSTSMDARMRANWDLYHGRGGSKDSDRVVEYDFEKNWPSAELEDALDWLRSAAPEVSESCAAIQFDGGEHSKTLTAERVGAKGDAGKTLSHVIAWVKARDADAQSVVLASAGAFINTHTGPPNEFDSFIVSFLLRGPQTWDVLFLDRGERGVGLDDAQRPEALMSNKAWLNPYVLYRNRAVYAGEDLPVGLYMVSKKFLDKMAVHMREEPLYKLDNWFNALCASKLECYSYASRGWYQGATAKHKARMAKPLEEAPVVDDAAVEAASAANAAASRAKRLAAADADANADAPAEKMASTI
jgi:hypothetical protein